MFQDDDSLSLNVQKILFELLIGNLRDNWTNELFGGRMLELKNRGQTEEGLSKEMPGQIRRQTSSLPPSV